MNCGSGVPLPRGCARRLTLVVSEELPHAVLAQPDMGSNLLDWSPLLKQLADLLVAMRIGLWHGGRKRIPSSSAARERGAVVAARCVH